MAVKNSSNFVIAIKLENRPQAVRLNPGGIWRGSQDGLIAPMDHPGKVFKSVDNVDLEILPGGEIRTTGSGDIIDKIAGDIGQVALGGWKDISVMPADWGRLVRFGELIQRGYRAGDFVPLTQPKPKTSSSGPVAHNHEREQESISIRAELAEIRAKPIEERTRREIDMDQYYIDLDNETGRTV
ncbi:hypothetical protein ACR9YC_07190 [Parasphingorhabdus sp. DH2-15]|uniref:hypothetical protein n=1 Tax=Parasphingorhabdus sp. DH2-15 TaxID=3444112 RepID=UPI003F684B85